MNALTVLHVSDLHFGEPAVPAQVEALEAHIVAHRYDVVAISGDLTQRAQPGEFQRARAFIRATEGTSRTIVVPGNHDVPWWRAPLGLGSKHKLTDRYVRYISTELEPTLHVPGATFVGLNTAHGVTRHTLTWNIRDVGILGDLRRTQIDRAGAIFADAPRRDCRVIVMHHNPVRGELSQRQGLKRTPQLLRALAEIGTDVVLCGHDHQEAVSYVRHERNGFVVSTAGTVSDRSRGGRPSAMNALTISRTQVEVVTWTWSRDGMAFVEGPSRCYDR